MEPTLENLENLDVSAFQAPEDLLDGCRVCLYHVIIAIVTIYIVLSSLTLKTLQSGLAPYLHKLSTLANHMHLLDLVYALASCQGPSAWDVPSSVIHQSPYQFSTLLNPPNNIKISVCSVFFEIT